MSLLLWSLIFILGLAATVVASEIFIGKAEEAGKKAKVSPFFSGVLIATFLVALPELFISILATANDYSSVVPTYVTGANLINLLLIPGLIALTAGSVSINKDSVLKQIPILLGSVILFLVLARDGQIDAWEGGVLLAAFLLFAKARHDEYKLGLWERIERLFTFGRSNSTPVLVLSLLVLAAGSYFTVRGMVEISEAQNWNPGYLASSLVALAVSVPEIIYCIRASKKGNLDNAVNVLIASTVVNTTLVMAVPSFVKSLNVLDDVVSISNSYLLFATLLFSLILLLRKWSSQQGGVLLLIYFVFLVQFLNPLFS